MRHGMKALLLAGALGACSPAQASAEGYVSPWVGVIFGNDQAASGFKSFGVAFGNMRTGVVGTETNIGFTSGFFGKAQDNYVLDISGSLTAGPNWTGAKVRAHPYFAIGLATIRTSIDGGNATGETASTRLGTAIGGGATVGFKSNVGIRGDVRYYRGFSNESPVNSLNVDLAKFHYWRASIGLIFWWGVM